MNQKTLDLIAQTLFDKKAANILVLDVRQISSMTDFFIIAEGNVSRHVREKYQLESLWKDATIVNVRIDVGAKSA